MTDHLAAKPVVCQPAQYRSHAAETTRDLSPEKQETIPMSKKAKTTARRRRQRQSEDQGQDRQGGQGPQDRQGYSPRHQTGNDRRLADARERVAPPRTRCPRPAGQPSPSRSKPPPLVFGCARSARAESPGIGAKPPKNRPRKPKNAGFPHNRPHEAVRASAGVPAILPAPRPTKPPVGRVCPKRAARGRSGGFQGAGIGLGRLKRAGFPCIWR